MVGKGQSYVAYTYYVQKGPYHYQLDSHWQSQTRLERARIYFATLYPVASILRAILLHVARCESIPSESQRVPHRGKRCFRDGQ